MNNFLKNYKLDILKKKYNLISNLLFKIDEHLLFLKDNYFINNDDLICIKSDIFELTKNLNVSYNEYINNYLDNINLDLKNIIDKTNNESLSKYLIKDYYEKIEKNPLDEILESIIILIKKYGFSNFKFLIELLDINNKNKKLFNLIDEINNFVVILSFGEFKQNKKSDDYYWRIPTNFTSEDNLELSRELWIKKNNNEYYKFNVVFKNDVLSIISKTSQINYKTLFEKKNMLVNKNKNIDEDFLKSFVRQDYLGNIYCMTLNEYSKHLEENFSEFNSLSNNTFMNIMKKFIDVDNKLKNMYQIIILLLLGDEDANNIAGLLLSLIKEKKHIPNNLYYYIHNNISFYLQSKMKTAILNVKLKIDKLKSLTLDDLDYKKQIAINKNMPDNVKAHAMEKIEEMNNANNEYFKQLTFVKVLLNYPWSSDDDKFYSQFSNSLPLSKKFLTKIENKLENLTYGHKEPKKLLLQIIAKWISNPSSSGTCFGLVGPPGVGKTLLAKSISKALDIPFGQITLGGQNDGELLHGHGYTYSGAQPGLIVKKMVEMGQSRCILYFDELDKATTKHGNVNEIMSILIHLTDPNMNKNFQDRFFQGIDFPLDKVIIIFSYNDSSLIDPILLDRIKEINVEPYSIKDKINICKNFVLPEMKENIGIKKDIVFSEDILRYLIENYTNEAGVRDIKRNIEKILLQLNLDSIFNRGLFKTKTKKLELQEKEVNDILSKPKIEFKMIHNTHEIGIINGLYATTTGSGGITPIQIFKNYTSKNKFEIKLTGSQGDVMKESVQCSLTTALNFIKNNLSKFKIKNLDEYMEKNFLNGFHVHAPSTSTPKDGPSAGCAFTSAFISIITNNKIKNNIAMTGEIELTGDITKIGGLNYKLIGAKKAGIKKVFVPEENKDDIDEFKKNNPNFINKDFEIKLVTNIKELIFDIFIL
jgi:endopeptidase La